MSLWVKICGNTSLEDALLATEAGADALGFVFAHSPRRVTVEQVAAITAHLPGAVEKIGVFVDAGLDEILAAVRVAGLTGVQVQSDASPELPALLHEHLGMELRILRVVHFGVEAAQQAAAVAADPHVDAVLVDSRTATAVGGTGVAYDWAIARKTLFLNSNFLNSNFLIEILEHQGLEHQGLELQGFECTGAADRCRRTESRKCCRGDCLAEALGRGCGERRGGDAGAQGPGESAGVCGPRPFRRETAVQSTR